MARHSRRNDSRHDSARQGLGPAHRELGAVADGWCTLLPWHARGVAFTAFCAALTESEVKLSVRVRLTVEDIGAKADRVLLGNGFRMILDAARKHNLYPCRGCRNSVSNATREAL